MKNVIVAGANGFIGSAFVNKLTQNKVNVIAIDVAFTKIFDNNYVTEVLMPNDVSQLKALIPLRTYDAFYNFAWCGVNGVDKADPLVQLQNTSLTITFAKLAKSLDCSKYLCAGTIAEQSCHSLSSLKKTNGGMMYGVVKHCTNLILETYCKNIDLNFVWMQFSNIYGPSNKTGNLVSYTLEKLHHGLNATFGPASQPYDFIYIDDLVDAIYRLGFNKTKHNSYFIGSGKPRILKDYLIEIGELCNCSDLIKIGERADDGIKYSFDMFDNSKLVEDIGEYVNVDFRTGIINTVNSYKEN